MSLGGGEGSLAVRVWPTHAGAVNAAGEEPIFIAGYTRGQIGWGLNEHGVLLGRVAIDVPPSPQDWTHIIYTHHPANPGYVTAQKLAHPIRLPDGGTITLDAITEADVNPPILDPVLHD